MPAGSGKSFGNASASRMRSPGSSRRCGASSGSTHRCGSGFRRGSMRWLSYPPRRFASTGSVVANGSPSSAIAPSSASPTSPRGSSSPSSRWFSPPTPFPLPYQRRVPSARFSSVWHGRCGGSTGRRNGWPRPTSADALGIRAGSPHGISAVRIRACANPLSPC